MSGQQEHYDILVVGKSGNGKSALCNTLLGREQFALGRSMATTTTTVQHADRRYGNMTIQVIDTPDVTNCGLNSERDRQVEVDKWKNLLVSPHPSMVLVAIRCDVRFTAEEFTVYREILQLWGKRHSLNTTLVVAFTFGDRQDYDIAEDVANPPPELGEILGLAKKRHMVFTNKQDSAEREGQARRCFSMLQDLQDTDVLCPRCLIM